MKYYDSWQRKGLMCSLEVLRCGVGEGTGTVPVRGIGVGVSPTPRSKLRIVPLELKQANVLVEKWHRHHKPVQGHRFSIGVIDERGRLVGSASVGRPVARNGGNPLEVLEVTRCVTDGTPNACSALYAATARIGKELGYKRIQTYILEEELGTTLRAAGWVMVSEKCGGGQWKHTDGKPRRTDQPIGFKKRWERILNV